METAFRRRVLIVEGNPDGHRLSYVSLLADASAAYGDRPIVASSERALKSEEWQIHLVGNSSFQQHIVQDFSLEGIGRVARELEIDHVVVPDGDALAYELALGRKWVAKASLSVLVMREKAQSRFFLRAWLVNAAKALLLQLANSRRRVEVRVLKSATWRGFSLLPSSRDPVVLVTGDTDAHPTGLPPLCGNQFWFGVIGKIGHRKNLPLVAASLASLNRADVGLLVAGQLEEGVFEQADAHLRKIRQAGGHVVLVDRLLTDQEMGSVIKAIDCVVLAHSNEGPSGILGKAVAAGTRIVAAGARSLKKDCQHIGSGAEWAPLHEQQLSAALIRATKAPRPVASRVSSTSDFAAGLLRREE